MSERTISSMFDEDHDRLDALFKSFQTLKRTDFPRAKRAFLEFKTGMQRHVAWEEDVMFPLWEKKSGQTGGGPTIVVDFGTATTLDAVSARGEYLGGAICPGVRISADALFQRIKDV